MSDISGIIDTNYVLVTNYLIFQDYIIFGQNALFEYQTWLSSYPTPCYADMQRAVWRQTQEREPAHSG